MDVALECKCQWPEFDIWFDIQEQYWFIFEILRARLIQIK